MDEDRRVDVAAGICCASVRYVMAFVSGTPLGGGHSQFTEDLPNVDAFLC